MVEGPSTEAAAALATASGWIGAAESGAGSGAVKIAPTPTYTVGLHVDEWKGTAISAITSMSVRVRSEGSGLGPRVTLRTTDGSARDDACNVSFGMPNNATWQTYDLTADANNFWTTQGDLGCPGAIPDGATWAQVKAALVDESLDDSQRDGVAGVRILAGDSGAVTYANAYVDWFKLNTDTSDFEAPTLTLAGANASIPAGGTINLPVGATLSGPNQPGFGNSLGVLTGDGGLTSSASVVIASNPAGLCTGSSTVTFPPLTELSFVGQPLTKVAPALAITTKSGDGGTCTISLANPVNATVSGSVTLTVTKTPTVTPPTVTPPTPQPVTCKATAVSNKSKIKLQMGPALPNNAPYKARLDVKKSGKWFRYLKFRTVAGPDYTSTVNVPKGTYRIKCYGLTEAQNNRSAVVKIKK